MSILHFDPQNWHRLSILQFKVSLDNLVTHFQKLIHWISINFRDLGYSFYTLPYPHHWFRSKHFSTKPLLTKSRLRGKGWECRPLPMKGESKFGSLVPKRLWTSLEVKTGNLNPPCNTTTVSSDSQMSTLQTPVSVLSLRQRNSKWTWLKTVLFFIHSQRVVSLHSVHTHTRGSLSLWPTPVKFTLRRVLPKWVSYYLEIAHRLTLSSVCSLSDGKMEK